MLRKNLALVGAGPGLLDLSPVTYPDPKLLTSFIDAFWDKEIVPALHDYIAIPNKSPAFDPEWEAHGYMEQALQLALDWLERHPLPNAKITVGRAENKTPLIMVDVPGSVDRTVVLYGHLDKQPEMVGWRADLGPWKPVYEDGKLYGRGGADDGYALFASVCAVAALQEQGVPHARCVFLIEFSEESGSPDLPGYVQQYAKEIGDVDLVVCLDSGAGNYDQLWSTTSLRGIVCATLRAQVLHEGVHSGDASGTVPSSFRVLKQLVSRLEDERSGEILPDAFKVKIPEDRLAQAKRAAEVLGGQTHEKFPFVSDMQPTSVDPCELILNRTWRAALSVVGQLGMPDADKAGSVLRPETSLRLSLRLPPTTDSENAMQAFSEILTQNAPYGAQVSLQDSAHASGWNAPTLAPWLDKALDEASRRHYDRPALHMGEGGTIPFMGMLGEKFPRAQFLVTGVLGPQSNAHGPNEFLHVPYAKKLTACVADVLASHACASRAERA